MYKTEEIANKILNSGLERYVNKEDGFKKLEEAKTLINTHVKEQLILHGVSVSLPTDPMVLAEYLHDSYETIAKKTKWNTQENCKVAFNDLPNENKTTMILLAGKLILDFVGNER